MTWCSGFSRWIDVDWAGSQRDNTHLPGASRPSRSVAVFALGSAAALDAESRVLILPEQLSHLCQRQRERRFQGVRWVDDEHAAGRQARADDFALFIGCQLAGFDG